eukprot:scaffold58_cov79-Skeletonema_marinoi.AAC.12
MANYHGSLEAADCHIHSMRYDMSVNRGAGGRLRCLIRSPYYHQKVLGLVLDCHLASNILTI